jgi:Ca-activated chloride channel homolog
MLPLIAILLPMLLIFLGFAVDLAYMQTTRMELQAAADVSARAGATRLSQTDDVADARAFAKQIAGQNQVAGAALRLRNNEVEFGRTQRNNSGQWVFTRNARPTNAVRVTAQRTAASRGGPVSLFFGSLIGTPTFQPVQTATASFLNVDVCLVLDRSTSMKLGVTEADHGMPGSDSRLCSSPNAASRWRALDGAVRLFVAELEDSQAIEKVALATYASGAESPMSGICGGSTNPSSLDVQLVSNLSQINSAMDRLSSTVWNGFTYIESGMRTGLAALEDTRYARDGSEKIMIVMTDGHQNVGNAANAARDCAAAGITIHTITFSDGANQTTMQSVADIGGGKHYHADTAADLRQVFRELAAETVRLTD